VVFLSGDLENKGEQVLLNYLESKPEIKEKLKNTSMLKANHHGSSGSNSKEFFSLFPSGTNILISSGKENKFGHPGEEAIKRMKDKEFKIKRTDQDGEITLLF
jgi:competence protein ComEC